MDLSGVPPEHRASISLAGRGNFRDTEWTELPEWLAGLTGLRELIVSGHSLTRLPDWLGDLANLTRLDLTGNQLTHVPETLGNLTALTWLSLTGNLLTELPESMQNLSALSYLSLSSNRFASVPPWLGSLSNLTTLYLWGNRLSELPDQLANLTTLSEIELSRNELSRVPECLRNLRNLASITLSYNMLTELPAWLSELTKLRYLELTENRLTRLPRQLAYLLTEGLELQLAGNPLHEPLAELGQRGPGELAVYLRSLDDAVAQYEAKLLLVGEGNVGKSSLVAALRGEPFVSGRPTTHGIEISPVKFRHPDLDLDMTLRAWDFGGQEVYRVSHQFFFSPRALYLVVWHARQGQEQDEVEGWLRRIKLRVGDNAVAIVVATHCRERLPDLDYPHLDRLFPRVLAGEFEIDSSTGDGVRELRAAISQQAAKLPQMGQQISPRWTAAREAVLALAETEPQIRYERFAEICEQHRVTGDEIGTLAKLMHDLGLIVYYDEDEGLKDIVVLNPEWLTKAISYVLDDRRTADAGGVLDHVRLKVIWQDQHGGYPAQYHPYFLRLMEKFDISYRLDGDKTQSLVPQLVPHQRPFLPWRLGNTPPAGYRRLSLTCRLSEPAPGLIPWLTVRHHRASTGKHWRRGVFLRHPIGAYHSEALLELVRDDELALEVRAPSPDLYFNVLRDSVEDLITRRWPGLTYRLFVPCPGTTFRGTPCKGQFPLDGLLRVREVGQTSTVSCMECGQPHEISVLLTGFTVPAEPLTVEIEQIHDQLAELTSGISGLHGQAAEIAGAVRRMHRVVSAEVTDCPRLFTFGRGRAGLINRVRFHRDHYRLTLWCEHPGYEHPWDAASYDLDPPREWFARVAPYAVLVFRILQLAVPVAAAIDVASLPAARQGDAQARLQVMQAIVADLPANGSDLASRDFTDRADASGQLTAAEGAALRAVRQIIFENDPLRAFGDMRRVQDPSGDLLWVCPAHHPEYDPGLPTLP